VAVAALSLVLLLSVQALVRGEPAARRLFAALALAQVGLVLVVLASALFRMRLYQEAYGLTELRFYTSAFMLWVGGLLVLFPLTVLRERRAAFAHGLLGSAFVVLLGLHAVDPERRIVVANRRAPLGFDVGYALRLGADAVEPLIETLPQLDPAERRTVVETLRARWAAEGADWRTWSLARARARRAVEALEAP
jgi:hypothetical protein